MKRHRRTPKYKSPSIVVVADGEIEVWYLNILKPYLSGSLENLTALGSFDENQS